MSTDEELFVSSSSNTSALLYVLRHGHDDDVLLHACWSTLVACDLMCVTIGFARLSAASSVEVMALIDDSHCRGEMCRLETKTYSNDVVLKSNLKKPPKNDDDVLFMSSGIMSLDASHSINSFVDAVDSDGGSVDRGSVKFVQLYSEVAVKLLLL